MNRLFSLIAENIAVVLGFAIYGATSLDRYFLVFFDHDAEKALRQTESRRDFSKNITTANSYIHRSSD